MPAGPRPNPPAHVVRVTVTGTHDVARWANTFWVRNGNETTPTSGDLTSFLNDFVDKFVTRFAPKVGATWTVTGGIALYYGPAGGILDASSSHTGAGALSGSNLPASVAMCVGWKVQPHYRGGHARTYLAGQVTGNIASTTGFSPTVCAAVAVSANSFLTDINGISHGDLSDLHLGTVSFVLAKAWRSPPIFRDFVPGAAHVDTRIDSQRRRLGRDIP